jgi:hypothetical protein
MREDVLGESEISYIVVVGCAGMHGWKPVCKGRD